MKKRFIEILIPLLLLSCLHLVTPIEKNEASEIVSDYVKMPTEEQGRGPYKNGVYLGSAPSYKNEMHVQVTITKGWISGLAIVKTDDDKEYLEKVESKLLNAVLETQSTDIDAITGATFTSYGILDGIDNALEKGV